MSDNATIITRRDIIRGVPERWKQQYKTRDGWGHVLGGNGKKVYDRLRALDLDTAGRAAVDDIIGNKTWTENECDLCEADVDTIVAIEGRWGKHFQLCLDCLAKVQSVVSASPAVVSGRSNE